MVHGFFHKKYGARGRNENKSKNYKMVGVKVTANPKHKEKKFSAWKKVQKHYFCTVTAPVPTL